MRDNFNYRFMSENGHCPQCNAFGRKYYIQDRDIGAGKYEYALMSMPIDPPAAQSFPSEKEMVSFLIGQNITDAITISLLLNQMTIYHSGSLCMLEQKDMKYVWDGTQKELREYTDPKQETGYCTSYRECLNMAKEILKNKEEGLIN